MVIISIALRGDAPAALARKLAGLSGFPLVHEDLREGVIKVYVARENLARALEEIGAILRD